MAQDKRPLSARLDAYIANLESIEQQMIAAAAQVEPFGGDGTPLRDGAALFSIVREDLRKVLEGEELTPFSVEGWISG